MIDRSALFEGASSPEGPLKKRSFDKTLSPVVLIEVRAKELSRTTLPYLGQNTRWFLIIFGAAFELGYHELFAPRRIITN